MAIRTSGLEVSFKEESKARMRIHKDQAVQIDMDKGQATLKPEGRQAYSFSDGHRHVIGAHGKVLADQKLSIRLISPQSGQRIFYKEKPPSVKFEWKSIQKEGNYRFQLRRGHCHPGLRRHLAGKSHFVRERHRYDYLFRFIRQRAQCYFDGIQAQLQTVYSYYPGNQRSTHGPVHSRYGFGPGRRCS